MSATAAATCGRGLGHAQGRTPRNHAPVSSSTPPRTPLRTMSAKRAATIWLGLAVVALVGLIASLALGGVPLAPSRVLAALAPSHAFGGVYTGATTNDLAGEI